MYNICKKKLKTLTFKKIVFQFLRAGIFEKKVFGRCQPNFLQKIHSKFKNFAIF